MLIAKTKPVGIDWYIDQLQRRLHSKLIVVWALEDTDQYKCYGRCDRNKTQNGYVAENYVANNKYEEVYWDKTLTAISFFGITREIKVTSGFEADVHLVFFADLEKLALRNIDGDLITHRADEELRKTVIEVIGKHIFGFSVTGIELWLENVLREYPGSRRDDRLKFIDMHPVHCFRINLKLLYNANKIC